MHIVPRKHFFHTVDDHWLIFINKKNVVSRNIETFSSECLINHELMFPLYYIYTMIQISCSNLNYAKPLGF